MALTQREAAAISERQIAATRQVRTRVLDALAALWGGLDGWRDDDLDRFLATALPLVEAGQRQTGALTVLWLGQLLEEAGIAVPDVDLDAATDVRPIGKREEYARPFVEVRTVLAQGGTLTEAVQRGGRRLQTLAATDMQLTKTHTSRQITSRQDGFEFYRRTLTGNQSCGLCVVASTQRYFKEDLLPIHPGCDCGVVPIVGDFDPGQVIDPQSLEQVHKRIEERFGTSDRGARAPVDYRDAIVTHTHGEIGPVIAVRGQKFTGPDDI